MMDVEQDSRACIILESKQVADANIASVLMIMYTTIVVTRNSNRKVASAKEVAVVRPDLMYVFVMQDPNCNVHACYTAVRSITCEIHC